jgi:hypothetical protein
MSIKFMIIMNALNVYKLQLKASGMNVLLVKDLTFAAFARIVMNTSITF